MALDSEVARGSDLRELASGIDALYMSGRGDVSPRLLDDLAAARLRAEEHDEAVPVDLGGRGVLVSPRSFGKYRYRLETEHGPVGVSPSTSLPPLRIQPLSEHLHAVGAAASIAWFADLGSTFTRNLRLHASRLDVFSDWHGLNLSVADRGAFVGRASRLDTHEDGGQLTGFEFGRRTSKTVLGRIYDKTLDNKLKGKTWWTDKWGSGYDPARQVMRVEFEFGREGLKQYGVDTAQDALDRAPGLYVTASTDWLSQRVPTADATRSRWPVSEAWETIQRASFAESAVGLERIRERSRTATLWRIRPPLIGYLSSFAALHGIDRVEDVLDRLRDAIRDDEIVRGVPFAERVRRRRLELRLP